MSPQFAPCRCGHSKSDHEALAPQCAATRCTCLRYVPKSAPERFDATPAHPAPISGPPLASVKAGPSFPVAASTPTAPTADQIIAAGKRSAIKRCNALAEKIEAELADLRDRIHAEREAVEAKERKEREKAEAARRRDAEKAEAKREVERLEAALKAARAKLHGRTPPAAKDNDKPVVTGQHICRRDDCGRSFDTTQARAMHERRAHDGFDPRAVKAG